MRRQPNCNPALNQFDAPAPLAAPAAALAAPVPVLPLHLPALIRNNFCCLYAACFRHIALLIELTAALTCCSLASADDLHPANLECGKLENLQERDKRATVATTQLNFLDKVKQSTRCTNFNFHFVFNFNSNSNTNSCCLLLIGMQHVAHIVG